MASPDRASLAPRLLRLVGWLLAWTPALIVLAMLLPLRVPVPFEDSWAYVQQYRDWWHGNYAWRDLLAPHVNHPTFTLGVLMLAATIAARDASSGWFRMFARRAGLLFLGGFIAMHAVNWNHGGQHMKWEHERMKQDRALPSFAKVLPLDREVMWQFPHHDDLTTQLAIFLEEHGRLKDVRMMEATTADSLRRGPVLPDKWASLDAPVVRDGVVHLRGTCGVSKDMLSLPDLVLIAAQPDSGPENVVSFAAPAMPFDFYENEGLRRLHVDHYFGWERHLPEMRLPKGQLTIRAYGYWTKGKSIRALSRHHVLQL